MELTVIEMQNAVLSPGLRRLPLQRWSTAVIRGRALLAGVIDAARAA